MISEFIWTENCKNKILTQLGHYGNTAIEGIKVNEYTYMYHKVTLLPYYY